MNVLFVHGYSETSLGAYFNLPERLKAAMPSVDDIVLAAFNSLDDSVTIDDLADAMEDRVNSLGAAWTTGQWAVVCHSTGALIARRWLLNRLGKKTIPSHLVTMAGANHGSTLAQMGKSVLGYVQKLFAKQSPTVGAAVLTDLDYGSDFLLRLNRDWMARWNDASLDALWAFSMGGDFVGHDPTLQIFWQTHEPGSDNTVRISGANLNYTLIEVSQQGPAATVTAIRPSRPVPHLVLPGYSHFGSDTGILGCVIPNGDAPLNALVQALSVTSAQAYASLEQAWGQTTDTWSARQEAAKLAQSQMSLVNSTLVLSLTDESGRSIDDCVISIFDQQALGSAANAVNPATVLRVVNAANNVSNSIMPHSPIQNNVSRGSYSFYFDFNKYIESSPHLFHIEAAIPSSLISFEPLTFTQPPNLTHTIYPNEFTYVSLKMRRDPIASFAVYKYGSDLNLAGTTWMPFPRAGQLP